MAVGRILRNDLYVGVLTQGISTTANYEIKQRIARSFILNRDWTNRLIEMGIALIITDCPRMDSDLYRRNTAFT